MFGFLAGRELRRLRVYGGYSNIYSINMSILEAFGTCFKA